MFAQILRNPTGGEGGGSSLAAGGPPAGAQFPPPGQPLNINITGAAPATQGQGGQGGQGGQPPPAPKRIEVDQDELARLYGAARDFETYRAAEKLRTDAIEAEKLKALGEKNGIEKQLNDYMAKSDKEVSEVRANWLASERDRAIAAACAGRMFISEDAADQARQLLALELEATMGPDNRPVTRDKTGRPADVALRELLDSPRFAHFLRAGHGGGAGAPAGGQSVPTPAPAGSAGFERDMAAIAAWQKQVRPQGRMPVGGSFGAVGQVG